MGKAAAGPEEGSARVGAVSATSSPAESESIDSDDKEQRSSSTTGGEQEEAGPEPGAERPREDSPVIEESGPGPTTGSGVRPESLAGDRPSRAPSVAEAGNRNGQKSRSAVEGGALARHHPGNTDQRKNRWRGDDPGYGAVRSRSPVDAPTRATCI